MANDAAMGGFETGGSQENSEAKVLASCQALLGDLQELNKKSQYQREQTATGETLTHRESGEKFEVLRVRHGDEELIQKMVDMQSVFPPEERDTIETFRNSLKENLDSYHVILKDGEVVAFICAGLYDVRKPTTAEFDSTIQPKQSILYMGYIVAIPEYQGKGLSTELYQNAFASAIEKARKEKSVIQGVISETVADREGAMNSMKRERLYYYDKEGNVREVPYFVASHDRDAQTGEKVVEDEAEHLMYRSLSDKKELSVEQVLAFVKTIYADNYILPDMETKDAQDRNEREVLELQNQLARELSQAQGGRVFLMNAGERELLRNELELKGKKLIDHITQNDKEVRLGVAE